MPDRQLSTRRLPSQEFDTMTDDHMEDLDPEDWSCQCFATALELHRRNKE